MAKSQPSQDKFTLPGSDVVDGAKDLFGARAQWVQTWVLSRGLPFAALIALVFSYYQIGSGELGIPYPVLLGIAVLALFIALVRGLQILKNKQPQKILGNYQLSLVVVALLLLLGSPEGNHSWFFWLFLIVGFWAVGFAYPKQLFMPGEFTAVAFMLLGVCKSTTTPIPDWIFVSLVIAPVIAWLQLKYQLLKPVLLLSALLLAYWLFAEEIDGWQTILAVVGATLMLLLAIYSLGQLAETGASSFVQSVGLGVISGLLVFVVIMLLGFDSEAASTWWSMFIPFIAICIFIYKRNGEPLLPLLILWTTHWSVIVASYSWEDWFVNDFFAELYGFHLAIVVGALALRYYAMSNNINRLLVWARIYLAIAALSLTFLFYFEDDLTLFRLVFTAGMFVFALWLAKNINLEKGSPWWKGVINPRHVVAVRKILRKSGNFFASVPFVGAIISAVIKSLQVISKLKRDGSNINSGDLLLIVWAASFALFLNEYLEFYLLTDTFLVSLIDNQNGNGSFEVLVSLRAAFSNVLIYVTAGILLGIINAILRQPIFLLLAMASFVIAPTVITNESPELNMLFWLTCFVSALGILSVREFGRDSNLKSTKS